ncbi:MAG: hypothetical protein U5K37_06630 [Natrialbaceae archaeon]|nr:hypothetical protein [Natrialbaceae archaeon]
MLADLLIQVAIVVGTMIVIGVLGIVGRYRLRATLEEWPDRIRAAGPVGLVLGFVLLVNRQFRQQAPELEKAVGHHITETIIQLEGDFVLLFQAVASSEFNLFFSFIYIYGYTFVLVFPVIAYFTLSNTRPLRELLTAYTIDYAIGLVCYVFFIAFGRELLHRPRRGDDAV